MKTNIYAVVENNSNRAISIIESGMVEWFKQNMPAFNIIEIGSVGTCTFNTSKGSISTISIYPIGKNFSKDAYHIIQSFSDTINLGEAYNLIK